MNKANHLEFHGFLLDFLYILRAIEAKPEQKQNSKLDYLHITFFAFNLPGHASLLHSTNSKPGPAQSAPPLDGAGLLQVRMRL